MCGLFSKGSAGHLCIRLYTNFLTDFYYELLWGIIDIELTIHIESFEAFTTMKIINR